MKFSLSPSMLYAHACPAPSLVVEGTSRDQGLLRRIGTIASTARGTEVRILECGQRKTRQIAHFMASNADQAVAMVHSHRAMAGLSLRTVH